MKVHPQKSTSGLYTAMKQSRLWRREEEGVRRRRRKGIYDRVLWGY